VQVFPFSGGSLTFRTQAETRIDLGSTCLNFRFPNESLGGFGMKMNRGYALVLSLLVALLLVSAAFAQETTAGIQGTVKDPQGLVVSKATVEVTGSKLIGAKKVETRSWATKYRGPLAIHASGFLRPMDAALCETEPFKAYITQRYRRAKDLPLGQIIAIVNLVDCIEIPKPVNNLIYLFGKSGVWTVGTESNEYRFGDYTPGRFAWILDDVKLISPIRAPGHLSLWDYKMSDTFNEK
jgi:hypothetical protein